MREARDERLAVVGLELVEAAAIDEPGDQLPDRHGPARVGGDRGVEVARIDGRRLRLCQRERRFGRPPAEVAHDLPADGQRMLIVERLAVRDARPVGVDLRPAEVLGAHVLAGRGLHQRRSAQEDRPGALDDDRLVAHRRDVRATCGRRAHDQRDLRDPRAGQPRLVVEDPPEVVAIREDLGLERQECAAAVDEVDARQPVLEGDLLRPEMLLDRHREVRPALDGRVVGDDDAEGALDAADAGHDPRGGRLVVVHPAGGQRAELEERRPGVEQPFDALTNGELAALAMAVDGPWVAARATRRDRRLASPQVADEHLHRRPVRPGVLGSGVERAAQDGHRVRDASGARGRRRGNVVRGRIVGGRCRSSSPCAVAGRRARPRRDAACCRRSVACARW